MEPFVDFGLFELMAASGLAWLGRKIYANRAAAFSMLIVSIIAPAVLLFFGGSELARWVAAVCLACALINAAVLFPLAKRGLLARADSSGDAIQADAASSERVAD